MSEKTTSEFMLEIASHYLMNGCDDCPFYNVTKTCDSKPINCNWMTLQNYFKAEESKEESKSAEPERTAKVETVEKPNVFKCGECGQYFHQTAWGSPVEYCSRCGCRLDWDEDIPMEYFENGGI